MHAAGTTIDGPWDEVMKAIGQCHTLVHNMGVVRIQSDIRIGTRRVLTVLVEGSVSEHGTAELTGALIIGRTRHNPIGIRLLL